MSNVTGPLPGTTPVNTTRTPQGTAPAGITPTDTAGAQPVQRPVADTRRVAVAGDPAVVEAGPDEGSINIPNLITAAGQAARPFTTAATRFSQAITSTGEAIGSGTDTVAGLADVAVNAADSQEAVAKALRNAEIPPNVASRLEGLRGQAIAAGRVVGAAGAVMALNDLAKAATSSPMDLGGITTAIANLAMNMDAVTTELVGGGMGALLEKVGGAGAVVGGLLGLVDKIQNWQENGGLNAQNILGVVGDVAQIAAGVCTFIPGAQVAVAPLYLISAGANLASMAIEHWDDIKAAANTATEWVGNTASAAVDAVGSGVRAAGDGIANAARSVVSWFGF